MRPDSGDDEASAFLPERLMANCDDDAPLASEVLQDFLTSTPARMARLAAAVASLDSTRIRLEAHAITGSSHTIGADPLAAVCRRLETAGRNADIKSAPALLTKAERRLSTLTDVLTTYLADH
jgi:HPt (histidine-containing phosphotransfer) domain-containing protein